MIYPFLLSLLMLSVIGALTHKHTLSDQVVHPAKLVYCLVKGVCVTSEADSSGPKAGDNCGQ